MMSSDSAKKTAKNRNHRQLRAKTIADVDMAGRSQRVTGPLFFVSELSYLYSLVLPEALEKASTLPRNSTTKTTVDG